MTYAKTKGISIREFPTDSGVYDVFLAIAGRRRSIRGGTVEQALALAEQLRARLVLGEDIFAMPKAAPAESSKRVEEYWQDFRSTYLASKAVLPSTVFNYTSAFTHHILPEIGHRYLDTLTSADMADLICKLTAKPRTVRARHERPEPEPCPLPAPTPGCCLACGKPTPTKFCDRSCAARLNNRLFPKRRRVVRVSTVPYAGLAHDTIDLILRNLSRFFNRARAAGLMAGNPLSPVDRDQLRELKRLYSNTPKLHAVVQPLEPAEVPIFLTAAREESFDIYVRFFTEIHTGMRAGEIAGLQWTDFRWTERQVSVERSWSRRTKEMHPTKGKKARLIDLSVELIEALRELQKRRRKEWFGAAKELSARGLWCDVTKAPRYVFCNSEGGISDHANVTVRHYLPVLKRAGLKRRRPHDLRHTFASLLLHRGAPPNYVQQQMGHSSIELTMNLYGHLYREANAHRYVDELPGPSATLGHVNTEEAE